MNIWSHFRLSLLVYAVDGSQITFGDFNYGNTLKLCFLAIAILFLIAGHMYRTNLFFLFIQFQLSSVVIVPMSGGFWDSTSLISWISLCRSEPCNFHFVVPFSSNLMVRPRAEYLVNFFCLVKINRVYMEVFWK